MAVTTTDLISLNLFSFIFLAGSASALAGSTLTASTGSASTASSLAGSVSTFSGSGASSFSISARLASSFSGPRSGNSVPREETPVSAETVYCARSVPRSEATANFLPRFCEFSLTILAIFFWIFSEVLTASASLFPSSGNWLVSVILQPHI